MNSKCVRTNDVIQQEFPGTVGIQIMDMPSIWMVKNSAVISYLDINNFYHLNNLYSHCEN